MKTPCPEGKYLDSASGCRKKRSPGAVFGNRVGGIGESVGNRLRFTRKKLWQEFLLREAVERLVQLYEETDKKDEAVK
jgi:hypothetical protein